MISRNCSIFMYRKTLLLPEISPYSYADLYSTKDSREPICTFLEFFLSITPSLPIVCVSQILADSTHLNSNLCHLSSSKCRVLFCSHPMHPCPEIVWKEKTTTVTGFTSFAFLLRNHSVMLPIVWCLKTYILSNFLVVLGGRLSRDPNNLHDWEWKVCKCFCLKKTTIYFKSVICIIIPYSIRWDQKHNC